MGDGEAQGYVRSRVRVWARGKKESLFAQDIEGFGDCGGARGAT